MDDYYECDYDDIYDLLLSLKDKLNEGKDTKFGNTFGWGTGFLVGKDEVVPGFPKEDRTKQDAIEKASKERWAASTVEADEMRRLTT